MRKLLLTLTLLSSPAMAQWQHVENIDLMTDKDTSFVYTTNSSRDSGLVVRCSGAGGFDIIARFDYLGDKYKPVAVRFDSGEPVNFNAIESTDGRGRFFSDDGKAKVLDGMRKSNRIVLRALDFRGTAKTEAYDLTGFSEASEKLACLPR